MAAHAQAAAQAEPDAEPRCVVRETARERLMTAEGRQLYVEPLVLESNSNGELLLAGTYNYLFEQKADGRWERAFAEDDSILGAVIPRTGPARVIPAPIPTRLIGSVRAAARADGGWDVVLSEVPDWTGEFRPDSIARLWHGIWDGARWTTLERLAFPAEGRLLPVHPSSLVRYGDTLAFALVRWNPGSLNDVVIFERRGERWSYEIANTRGGAYAQLAYSERRGLVLALVQPDRSLRSDGNSLFLWSREPEWRPLRKVVPSSREQVHEPWLEMSASGSVLAWQAAVEEGGETSWRARAIVGDLEEHDAPVLTLDTAITTASPVAPVTSVGGEHVWVLDHRFPDVESREIRVVRHSADSVITLGSIPNPYMTSIATAAPTPGEFVVAGGIHDSIQDLVVTLPIRLRVDCGGTAFP